MTWLAREVRWFSAAGLSAVAWRNSGIPELGVYLVNPACNAAIAAALMCSGVSKSGSPAPKPQTSIPSDFIAFALLSIDSVIEGVTCVARSEISMSILVVRIQGAHTFGARKSFQSKV